MVAMLRDRIHELRERIELIARKHGAIRLRLFGSVARGEERPESDVDFLVTLAKGRSLMDRVHLKDELEELLGRRVELVSEKLVARRIARRVLAEARPL